MHVPVGGDGGDLGDFGGGGCSSGVGGGTRQRKSTAEDNGIVSCCHVLDALSVDGAGEDDSSCCALFSALFSTHSVSVRKQ